MNASNSQMFQDLKFFSYGIKPDSGTVNQVPIAPSAAKNLQMLIVQRKKKDYVSSAMEENFVSI